MVCHIKWIRDKHGYIDAPIGRNPESIISRIVDPAGQAALTEYWLKEQVEEASLLSASSHTGRTHQIRVHLAHKGGPLVGDDLYGGVKDSVISRQALHCGELQFVHPFTGEDIHIKQAIPEDMHTWLNIRKEEIENGKYLKDLLKRVSKRLKNY